MVKFEMPEVQVIDLDVNDIIENTEEQPAFPSAPVQQEAPAAEAPATENPVN